MLKPLPPAEHQRLAEHLLHEWARAIDEDRVEDACALLHEQGRYTVQSRFNADRGLPHALIDARSAAQLRDRVKSMRLANIYEPHHYRHLLSGIQVVAWEEGELQLRSSFAVVRTMSAEGEMELFAVGECRDRVALLGDGQACFLERHFLLDSRAVRTLLVIPL